MCCCLKKLRMVEYLSRVAPRLVCCSRRRFIPCMGAATESVHGLGAFAHTSTTEEIASRHARQACNNNGSRVGSSHVTLFVLARRLTTTSSVTVRVAVAAARLW